MRISNFGAINVLLFFKCHVPLLLALFLDISGVLNEEEYVNASQECDGTKHDEHGGGPEILRDPGAHQSRQHDMHK